jgi:hypothetical protein
MVYEFLPHCFRITEQAPHEYMNVIVLEVTFSEAKTGLDKVMKYLERVKQIRKTFAH